MTDTDFDSALFDGALVAAALRLAAADGWPRVSVAAAARTADLPLHEARARFPSRNRILLRFGSLVDQAALTDAPAEGPVRDRLFDLLMRRFDAFQAQRDGVIAVLRALPFDPALAIMLGCATERSMRWMLEGAGVTLHGPRGDIIAKGCVGVWLWTLRAWERDTSEDLSGTMAALDTALQRAERAVGWLGGPRGPKPVQQGDAEAEAAQPDEADQEPGSPPGLPPDALLPGETPPDRSSPDGPSPVGS